MTIYFCTPLYFVDDCFHFKDVFTWRAHARVHTQMIIRIINVFLIFCTLHKNKKNIAICVIWFSPNQHLVIACPVHFAPKKGKGCYATSRIPAHVRNITATKPELTFPKCMTCVEGKSPYPTLSFTSRLGSQINTLVS